ncbi:MAG: hypothetical protein JGK33_06230 [Microcoleus sp. PH2017_11_PCY_U_A]|nr:hypothetical protein [Microcoleus sp. PH2017_11_PCY_U_A]
MVNDKKLFLETYGTQFFFLEQPQNLRLAQKILGAIIAKRNTRGRICLRPGTCIKSAGVSFAMYLVLSSHLYKIKKTPAE